VTSACTASEKAQGRASYEVSFHACCKVSALVVVMMIVVVAVVPSRPSN